MFNTHIGSNIELKSFLCFAGSTNYVRNDIVGKPFHDDDPFPRVFFLSLIILYLRTISFHNVLCDAVRLRSAGVAANSF